MKSTRIEQLTFTRFIAAIAVVAFHYAQNIYPFNTQVLSTITQNGNLAVGYFFVLSGFVLYLSQQSNRDTYFSFLMSRLSRIFPSFIIAAILGLVYLSFSDNSSSFKEFFIHISLTQAWFPQEALIFNSPAWSLSVEFAFYLFFPLIFWLNKRLNLKWSILINVSLLAIVIYLSNVLYYSHFYSGFPSNSHNFLFYNPLFHIPAFSLGMLSARIYLGVRSFRFSTSFLILFMAVTTTLLYMDLPIFLHNSGLALLFAGIILCLALEKGRWIEFLKLPIFVFLGSISYAIYILQEPIFQLMYGLNSKLFHLNDSVLFYASLFVLILTASLVYQVIERIVHQKVKAYFS